jgi:hypothetical protein
MGICLSCIRPRKTHRRDTDIDDVVRGPERHYFHPETEPLIPKPRARPAIAEPRKTVPVPSVYRQPSFPPLPDKNELLGPYLEFIETQKKKVPAQGKGDMFHSSWVALTPNMHCVPNDSLQYLSARAIRSMPKCTGNALWEYFNTMAMLKGDSLLLKINDEDISQIR